MADSTTKNLIKKLALVKNGFKLIRTEMDKLLCSQSKETNLELVHQLYQSNIHQARMGSVMIFGHYATTDKSVLSFLRKTVSNDPSWQVQEMLAMAFDQYCKDMGYKKALPIIKSWLKDKNPNVRRAVTEGLRVWTKRDYFKEHPDVAIALLTPLIDDKFENVRKSVLNALNDINKSTSR